MSPGSAHPRVCHLKLFFSGMVSPGVYVCSFRWGSMKLVNPCNHLFGSCRVKVFPVWSFSRIFVFVCMRGACATPRLRVTRHSMIACNPMLCIFMCVVSATFVCTRSHCVNRVSTVNFLDWSAWRILEACHVGGGCPEIMQRVSEGVQIHGGEEHGH